MSSLTASTQFQPQLTICVSTLRAKVSKELSLQGVIARLQSPSSFDFSIWNKQSASMFTMLMNQLLVRIVPSGSHPHLKSPRGAGNFQN